MPGLFYDRKKRKHDDDDGFPNLSHTIQLVMYEWKKIYAKSRTFVSAKMICRGFRELAVCSAKGFIRTMTLSKLKVNSAAISSYFRDGRNTGLLLVFILA